LRTLTDILLETAPDIDRVFREAVDRSDRAGGTWMTSMKPLDSYDLLASVRTNHGFRNLPVPLLTAPDGNHKLAGASVPSYGLTLAHFRTKLPGLSVNACPNAGHCTKVCVVDNGNGAYDSVQRARKWRTELVAKHPYHFARILAWELTRAVRKHGSILFRPNVNSDVAWHRILPPLCNGSIDHVLSYGYSKLPETLEGNGWLGTHYRVAYSWNETSDPDAVRAFLLRGGAVAVVTSRRKGEPAGCRWPFMDRPWMAVDADTSDEWMFDDCVIGDLSAKGKARRLIGKSKFIVTQEES